MAVEFSYERSCEDHTAPRPPGAHLQLGQAARRVITLVLTLLGLLIAAIGLFR